MAVWSRYKGNNDKSDGPPPNPCEASGTSDALIGDTHLLQEDEARDAQALEVNAFATARIKIIDV